MDQKALMDTILKGRFEYLSTSTFYSPLPGAAFQENRDGSIYYATGIDFATCNGVIADAIRLSEMSVEAALEFFKSRHLPFILWASSNSIEHRALQFGGNLTGIALDISNDFPHFESLPEVEVRMISSPHEMKEFARLAIHVAGGKATIIEELYAVNRAAMDNGQQTHFLAYLNGLSVGTATLSTTESAAGVWNLTTLAEHRKKGVGTALVHAALLEAKKQHYEHVMAILMPKGMAWGLFTKLGFQEVCQFPFYVAGMSADALEK